MDLPAIEYVATQDGFSIAYSVCGEGHPLVFVPPVMHHVHEAWQEEGRREWLQALASRYRLVLYDGRGTGLSTRGLPQTFKGSDRIVDLETVVDEVRLESFVLLAVGTNGHSAIGYATRHPERVSALVLISCGIKPQTWPPALLRTLAQDDWDTFLYTILRPGRSHEATLQVAGQMKRRVDQDDFAIMVNNFLSSSIQDELERLTSPTLVIHPRGVKVPSYEDCGELASRIPGSRFAIIEGTQTGGLVYGTFGDPESGMSAIEGFLAGVTGARQPLHGSLPATKGIDVPVLSMRQQQVLRLLAEGKTTREIAAALVLSERTVERHIADIYTRIGARNRAEATAYALGNLGAF
jgi:pimeloyl-ACP methyl ester carboxylesterase/DNA-binding CsgD family transcriptional regulator